MQVFKGMRYKDRLKKGPQPLGKGKLHLKLINHVVMYIGLVQIITTIRVLILLRNAKMYKFGRTYSPTNSGTGHVCIPSCSNSCIRTIIL